MANIKSAKKRARQMIVRNARNSDIRAATRTAEKKLRGAIESKDAKAAQDLLKAYASRIGKAAQKGIYHAKTASRKISRLSKSVSQIG